MYDCARSGRLCRRRRCRFSSCCIRSYRVWKRIAISALFHCRRGGGGNWSSDGLRYEPACHVASVAEYSIGHLLVLALDREGVIGAMVAWLQLDV